MDVLAGFRRSCDVIAVLRACAKRWRSHRQEVRALRDILEKPDDRLLDDAGITREAAHRSLGEAPLFPGRDWDRWQL